MVPARTCVQLRWPAALAGASATAQPRTDDEVARTRAPGTTAPLAFLTVTVMVPTPLRRTSTYATWPAAVRLAAPTPRSPRESEAENEYEPRVKAPRSYCPLPSAVAAGRPQIETVAPGAAVPSAWRTMPRM